VSEERVISETEPKAQEAAEPEDTRGGWLQLAGGLTLGTAGALLVALPGAWRASASGASFMAGWLVLWGAAALLVGPLAGALRLLRPEPRGLLTLLLGVGLASGPLTMFAQVLKQTTHHRPLGAVTFAVLGTAVLLGALAIAARVMGMARSAGRGRRWGRVIAIVLAAIAGLFVLRLIIGALLDGSLRSGLGDGVLAVLAVVAGAFVPVPETLARRTRLAGPGAWLLVVMGALCVLHLVDGLPAILDRAAPVLYSALALMGH
jgi:hypothetical protein